MKKMEFILLDLGKKKEQIEAFFSDGQAGIQKSHCNRCGYLSNT